LIRINVVDGACVFLVVRIKKFTLTGSPVNPKNVPSAIHVLKQVIRLCVQKLALEGFGIWA